MKETPTETLVTVGHYVCKLLLLRNINIYFLEVAEYKYSYSNFRKPRWTKHILDSPGKKERRQPR